MLFNFDLSALFSDPNKIFSVVVNFVVFLSVFSVVVAVLIDFIEFHQRKQTKKEKNSIVETGTMFFFFFFFYFFIRFSVGIVNVDFLPMRLFLLFLGLFMVVIGCLVNVAGRFNLGKNWSNQIKIYNDHHFISSGMYGLVRHPLYASIIWMFFGASLVYSNWVAFLSNIFIFIPFMYYRARQEEALLETEFAGYKEYKRKVGMFLPNLFNKKQ